MIREVGFWRAAPGSRLADSGERLGRGGGRSGHWSCTHWLRAMAGIDAGEGAAAAPPEMSPEQRIEQVRRVSAWGPLPSLPPSLVCDPHPIIDPVRRWLLAGCRRPSGSWSRDWLESVRRVI